MASLPKIHPQRSTTITRTIELEPKKFRLNSARAQEILLRNKQAREVAETLNSLGTRYPPVKRSLSHYTNLGSLISIIENHQFWASNVLFLNDSNEIVYGIGEATTFLDEQKSSFNDRLDASFFEKVKLRILDGGIPDVFACCFCEQGDSLGQWRGYGGVGQNVSIEFDSAKLQAHLGDSGRLRKVIYGKGNARQRLQQAVNELISEKRNNDLFADITHDNTVAFEQLITGLAPQFKHMSFEDEREWRFIANAPSDDVQVHYRARDNVIVPYLKLGNPDTPLPIERIRVGPGKDPNTTIRSIENFLRSRKDYSAVPVVRSNVPFRT